MKKSFYSWNKNGLMLELQIQTKASKDAIIGNYNDRLKISITAAPENGKANRYLVKFLAGYFGVPQKQVIIKKGHKSKYKSAIIMFPGRNLNKLYLKEVIMSENVIVGTDDSFASTVLQSATPVLVDFWAEWCNPCRMIAPTIEAIAKEFSGKVKVVKVNVDENGKTASDYDIRGIPALVLFKDGKIVATKVGVLTKDQLADFVNSNLL